VSLTGGPRLSACGGRKGKERIGPAGSTGPEAAYGPRDSVGLR
jgi:hypothetical protein